MPSIPPPAVAHVTEKIRNGLIGAGRKMVPPNLAALDFVTDLWSFSIVYSLIQTNIIEELAKGTSSASKIALALNANDDSVYRLMCSATYLDILQESSNRNFSLT